MRKFFLNRGIKGFTLIELMVSLMVLSLISLFSSRIYLNYTSSSRDIKAGNMVYEEARILMERIVREVRQNAIDYEEYFNQNVMIPLNGVGSYGNNYCAYSSFFYSNNGESIGRRNPDQEAAISAASLDPAAAKSVEGGLFLINISGNKRTFLTRIEEGPVGEEIGKVAMLKMIGKDFGEDGIDGRNSFNRNATNGFPIHNLSCTPDDRENDGLIDTWHCDPDYPCTENEPLVSAENPLCDGFTHVADADHGFVNISPDSLNIVDLKFMITPEDDPWKAYNMDNVQIQPHVTIQLTVEANPKLVDTSIPGPVPSITLTSTITSRNYSEINSDCF